MIIINAAPSCLLQFVVLVVHQQDVLLQLLDFSLHGHFVELQLLQSVFFLCDVRLHELQGNTTNETKTLTLYSTKYKKVPVNLIWRYIYLVYCFNASLTFNMLCKFMNCKFINELQAKRVVVY